MYNQSSSLSSSNVTQALPFVTLKTHMVRNKSACVQVSRYASAGWFVYAYTIGGLQFEVADPEHSQQPVGISESELRRLRISTKPYIEYQASMTGDPHRPSKTLRMRL